MSRVGPRVCRLAAGGRWIRTIGTWREGAGFCCGKRCGGSNPKRQALRTRRWRKRDWNRRYRREGEAVPTHAIWLFFARIYREVRSFAEDNRHTESLKKSSLL